MTQALVWIGWLAFELVAGAILRNVVAPCLGINTRHLEDK